MNKARERKILARKNREKARGMGGESIPEFPKAEEHILIREDGKSTLPDIKRKRGRPRLDSIYA